MSTMRTPMPRLAMRSSARTSAMRRGSGTWDLTGFARVDNLFGRRYAGSVIVNEGNARFFEPAPGRTWIAGLSATIGF